MRMLQFSRGPRFQEKLLLALGASSATLDRDLDIKL